METKSNQKVPGEFSEEQMHKIAQQQLGLHLDEDQKRFLRAIRTHRVVVEMTKEAKNNRKFLELVGMLSLLNKIGTIPGLKIIEV